MCTIKIFHSCANKINYHNFSHNYLKCQGLFFLKSFYIVEKTQLLWPNYLLYHSILLHYFWIKINEHIIWIWEYKIKFNSLMVSLTIILTSNL